MDLAIYINELLEMHGEIIVPGLGSFIYTRVNGYYNDAEKKFYPPSYELHFDPQSLDDEVLANYISTKKNISPSSAKYFIDKYINNLKEQIAIYEVAFTDIGYLYTENGKLAFKPKNEKPPVNADFYGYMPVKMYKAKQRPAFVGAPIFEAPSTPKPTVAEELSESHVAPPVPDQHNLASAEHNYAPEEAVNEIQKNGLNIWIIITIAIALLVITVFVAYRYNPNIFSSDSSNQSQPKMIVKPVKPQAQAIDSAKNDSEGTKAPAQAPGDTAVIDTPKPNAVSGKSAPASTTAPNTAATTPVTAPTSAISYEIMGGAFASQAEAQTAVNNYIRLGIKDARILDRVPGTGNKYKVSLGRFDNRKDANKARQDMIDNQKVSSQIYIQPYPNKK